MSATSSRGQRAAEIGSARWVKSAAPVFQNAAEVAANLIRDAILDGRIKPGEKLAEARLAADLGISRTPIREALFILQTEGIAQAEPNRGSFVREFTADEISDLYETRAMLEAHAAARAAKKATTTTVSELLASCSRFARIIKTKNVRDLVRENLAFHDIILDAAASPSARELLASVTRLPLVYRTFFWYSSQQRTNSLRHHRAITRAIAEHSVARAERLMSEHILAGRDVLVAHLAGRRTAGVGSEAAGKRSEGNVRRLAISRKKP